MFKVYTESILLVTFIVTRKKCMTDVLQKEQIYFGLSIQRTSIQCDWEGTKTEAGRDNSTVSERTGKQNETNTFSAYPNQAPPCKVTSKIAPHAILFIEHSKNDTVQDISDVHV